jgi:hypothetical protein
MPISLFYITNNPHVAKIAETYGVDRIWIDLETIGKKERQKGLNTVKSQHTISDIAAIKPLLTKSEMLVRVNPLYNGSEDEINAVIEAGADVIMLPYWKSVGEVQRFLSIVNGRTKTTLLLETKEAVDCINDVLKMNFDEIHIGLNDLHLSYGMTFMFELLANGTVEMLCGKFKEKGIPYGFGGIAKIGEGLLPAERILMEHYRLGSSKVILSRSFCDYAAINSLKEIDRIFKINIKALRDYELSISNATEADFLKNKDEIAKCVGEVVANIKRTRNNEC